MAETVCPVCGAGQPDGLACHSCTLLVERALGDVASVIDELNVALSQQAKIGAGGKSGKGWVREKTPLNLGAMEVGLHLRDILVGWARDISNETWHPSDADLAVQGGLTRSACRLLLSSIPDIRKHPAAKDVVEEVTTAVEQARRVVDRPADRMYLGQCATVFPDEDGIDVECYAELWGRPEAAEVSCRVCGYEHEVFERRKWLIAKAAEMVVTAKEASRYLSDVGQLDVSESSIRNWVGRGKVMLRPGLSTQRQFELGALMDYIAKRDADAVSQQGVAEMPLAV